MNRELIFSDFLQIKILPSKSQDKFTNKITVRGGGSPENLAQPVLVGVVRVEVVRELLGALLDQMGGDALHAGGGRAGPREELVYEEAGKMVPLH